MGASVAHTDLQSGLFEMNAILLGTVLGVVTLLVWVYRSYSKLAHVPGPWYVGVTPCWLIYHTLKSDIYLTLEALIGRYGHVTRIAPNIVVTDDPSFFRAMEAPRAPYIRGHWFHGMKVDPRTDNIVSTTDEKVHAELRSKMIAGYSGKEVAALEANIDAQVVAMLDLIQRESVDQNQTLDFAPVASYFTLDVLSQIAFGSVFGFLQKNCDLFDYHRTTAAFVPILELGSNVPFVLKLLNSRVVQALAGPKPSDKVGLGALMGKAHAVVADRYTSDTEAKGNDMLASFIKHGLSQVECESESIIQILAGSDSTSTALRITFWHIMCNPPVYTKLMQEITSAVDSGRVSHPVLTDVEAKALPYLQACIREGLRIFMPLNGLATRVCPPGGVTWADVHIPAGTEIGLSVYTMNRRTDIFGPDADTFRPERFLAGTPGSIKEMERVQELCFGYGRHSCLGKTIALIELGKAIFELFRNYEFAVVNPLNAVDTKSNGVVLQKGMYVRAWKRGGV